MKQDRHKHNFPSTTVEIISQDPVPVKQNGVKNGIYIVAFFAALPCIPVVVISIILLYFIFHYRVIPQPGWTELAFGTTHTTIRSSSLLKPEISYFGGKSAYYVAYSPTTITTIAAVTSRVIPYMSSSIMALVAVLVARHLLINSKQSRQTTSLPPEQMTLLVGLLNGSSFGPLWNTVSFRYGKGQRLVHPLPAAFTALALITLTGILIPAIDTWFGISVQPVIITQLNQIIANQHSFGRQLNSTIGRNADDSRTVCPGTADTIISTSQGQWLGCNLLFGPGHVPFLQGDYEVSKVLEGISVSNTVANITLDPSRTLYYLGDAASDRSRDFKTKSYAMATECSPMTSQCLDENPMIEETAMSFNCTPGFYGNLTMRNAQEAGALRGAEFTYAPSVGVGFTPDTNFSKMIGMYKPDSSESFILPQNPIHFAAWASGFITSAGLPIVQTLSENNKDIVQLYLYNFAWILNCSSTIYDFEYTWVDGAVRNYTMVPSSAEMGGLVSGPFSQFIFVAYNALMTNAQLASDSTNMEQLITTFANGFSETALAMTLGVMVPEPNEFEQSRDNNVGVAYVPKIPLYFLLGFKLLYVIAVVALAISAYIFAHPAEMDIAMNQLTIKGVAKAYIEQPELIQETILKNVQSHQSSHKGVGQ